MVSITDIETTLLNIWSTILNKDVVHTDEDFLELGGDSLVAMRCINRIMETFGVELELDVFFNEPATIHNIAVEVEKAGARPRETSAPHNFN